MEYKIEYLIILKSNGSFCNDISSFNNLLSVNSLIKIEDENIIYNQKKFQYFNVTNIVKEKNQHYFKLCIISTNDDDIEDFQNLLKIIREVIYKADAHINILWDDISNYYSIKAYPEINKIENLLRKLITTFMLINLGLDWSKEATPSEVKTQNKRGATKESPNANFLHDTDFIQLADFLFKPYSNKDIHILFKELKKVKSIEELDLTNLKEFIPRSNWDRYFKIYVDCEDEYLNKNWNKLYDYRCKVAHNSFVSKSDYFDIEIIVNDLEEKFVKAIDNIDTVIVPQSEKSGLIENVLSNHNEKFEVYFKNWNLISNAIKKLYVKNCGEIPENYRIRELVESLVKKQILNESFFNNLQQLGIFYNLIVEDPEKISEQDIEKMNKQIEQFYIIEIVFDQTFNDDNLTN